MRDEGHSKSRTCGFESQIAGAATFSLSSWSRGWAHELKRDRDRQTETGRDRKTDHLDHEGSPGHKTKTALCGFNQGEKIVNVHEDTLPRRCRESWEMTEQIDWQAKQPSQVTCVPEDLKMLRSSRHYLRAQSQGHHITDHLQERGVERGSAGRPSLKRTR